jgi:hypothetical protein
MQGLRKEVPQMSGKLTGPQNSMAQLSSSMGSSSCEDRSPRAVSTGGDSFQDARRGDGGAVQRR